jgi:hypothetical protein
MVQAFKGIGTEYVTAANAYFSAMSDLSTGGASAGTEVMSAGQLTSATRGTLHDDAIRAIIAAGALDSVNLEGSHMGDADALNNWDAYAGTLDAVLVAGGNWTANFTALTTDINATNDLSKFFGVAHATITSAQFKSHSNIVTAQTERNNAIALFTYLYARHLNGTAGQAITTAGMGVRAGAGAANGVAIRGSSYHAMWRLLVYALYGYVDPK